MTVHDARGTCATLHVDLDVHPRVIVRILRHADVSGTMEISYRPLLRASRGRRRALTFENVSRGDRI